MKRHCNLVNDVDLVRVTRPAPIQVARCSYLYQPYKPFRKLENPTVVWPFYSSSSRSMDPVEEHIPSEHHVGRYA